MSQIKYIRIHTLRDRGPVEGRPNREVDGLLLAAEQSVLHFEDRHSECGHDAVTMTPAFHNGTQAWLLSRSWIAADGYSAWGSLDVILPLEDGIRILVDRGVFRLEPPAVHRDDAK